MSNGIGTGSLQTILNKKNFIVLTNICTETMSAGTFSPGVTKQVPPTPHR